MSLPVLKLELTEDKNMGADIYNTVAICLLAALTGMALSRTFKS